MSAAAAECTRHGFSFSAPGAAHGPWWAHRCTHLGDRFLLELRAGQPFDTWVIDFVRDLPGGGVRVQTVARGILSVSGERPDQAWAQWEARLLAGAEPDPEQLP